MKNLRIKIKENLRLNANIDYLYIKNIHTNKVKSFMNYEDNNPNVTIIYELIHKHSNYESIMWDFWKKDKESCIKEITNLLFEISKLDKMLTWDCDIVLSYYINTYKKHHRKSLYVESNNHNHNHNHELKECYINIELPNELIKLSATESNLIMDADDAAKLESFFKEFKNEFKRLVGSLNSPIDECVGYNNNLGKF